jgi:hypothetical protein
MINGTVLRMVPSLHRNIQKGQEMLASHNLCVSKENYRIIDELEAKGYSCLAEARGLTGTIFSFVQDVNDLMPVDDRVSTYTITTKQKVVKQTIYDLWPVIENEDKILYVAHPDRGVVDLDQR